jgi:ABC-2 type transport system permease protein
MLITVAVYMTGVGVFAEPGVLRALLSAKTALLILGLGPMTSAVALQVGVIVSARVNDPRTAQQFGALFILPLTGLFMAQMSGAFVLSLGMGLVVLAGLVVLWVLLLLFGIAIFQRETILTRWK